MGLLKCQLFQTPPEVRARLERCLLNDADHITPGSRGEHVRKIQIALNRLSKGPGRENFNLKEDGDYGPVTAAAVKAYKNAPSRKILQPWQRTADDIVGKRTIKSIDDEMEFLENERPVFEGFISPTPQGSPHDHTKCPTPPRVSGFLVDGHASHWGTPINPKDGGKMINLYGEGETDYLGFVDFATEPEHAHGRPLTKSLPGGIASDICMRASPISRVTVGEIRRLARPPSLDGCRFTYAATQMSDVISFMQVLLTLGIVIQQARIVSKRDDGPDSDAEVWVIELQ